MNYTNTIFIMVKIGIYAVFLAGMFLLLKDVFYKYYIQIRMRNRLKTRRQMMKEETRLEKHLYQLVLITLKVRFSGKNYLFATFLIFTITMIVGMQSISLLWSFVLGGLMALLPYLLLRAKLETHRTKGSLEGEQLVAEFLSQYRINKYNIYMTIETVIAGGKNLKISSNLLFNLLLEIRNTGNADTIRRATDHFHYAIHTNWSRMLAYNIGLAAESGANVSLAFEDVLIQLREARTLAEERKRMNAEAGRMVMLLVPIMYLGTVFMSTKYLDLLPKEFLHNQLYTPQGFVLALSILILFIGNMALLEIVNNQRFDY